MSRGNTYSDPRDANRVPATMGVSSADGTTTLPIEINTSTGRTLVDSLITNTVTSPGNVTDVRNDYTMYGALNVDSLEDQISVPFFNTAELNTQTISLAANGGSEAITNANLVISTGTATNGVAGRRSKSRLLYDPGHEARSEFTTIYAPTTAGAVQQHGLMTEDYSNGAYFENDGTGFFIVHKRGGVEVSKLSSANWNGNISTQYTLNGVVVPFNDTERANGLVYMIKFGYLGYLGIEYWVYAPDGNPVLIHRIKYRDTTPLFYDLSLYMVEKATKTSGTSNILMYSGSWEAGIFGVPVDPVISSFNSSTTALTAGATFTGEWQSVAKNKSLSITIQTDKVSSTNGIVIAFSDRGDTGAVMRTERFDTFSASDVANGFKKITIPTELSFVKITYTNGGVNQGSFFLQTRLHETPLELPRGGIEAEVNAASTALMTRGIGLGKSPIDNTYRNITASQPDSSGRVGEHIAIMKQDVELQQKSLSSASYASATVTAVAAQLDVSTLANRKYVLIGNNDNNTTIYYGFDSAVTISSGFPLSPGVAHQHELDPTVHIWAIAAAGTISARIIQVAGTV